MPPDRANELPPPVLTMGEPAGIGGESTLKAWLALRRAGPAFATVDSPSRLAALARRLGLDVPVREIAAPGEASGGFAEALPVLPLDLARPPVPGRPDPANAAATLASIDRAAFLTGDGQAAAMVTNPIHKATLYAAGFRYPGHTEYLAAKAGVAEFAMMLVCAELRVVPATIHLPLAAAIAGLDTASIVVAGRVTARALRDDFGIARPRLAVAGLNPHAGEGGALGREDGAVVAPAVDALCAEGIDAFGPLSPDSLFAPRARAGYDAAICMYHDQALIPVKTLDSDGGVNVTLGLPFVRTSPDHGTAFDIAGTGKADAGSLIAALRLAADLARRRAARTRPA